MISVTITSGGVDTVEYGAISGDLELSIVIAHGKVIASICYVGSSDSYTVVGSSADAAIDEESAARLIIGRLSSPVERDRNGNVPVLDIVGLDFGS